MSFSVRFSPAALALAACLSSTALHAGELGPVTPNAAPGGYYIGLGGSAAKSGWEDTNFYVDVFLENVDTGEFEYVRTIKQQCYYDAATGIGCGETVESTLIYFEGGYAFSRGLEAYLRGGISDLKIISDDPVNVPTASFGYSPYLAAGLRSAVWRGERFATGPALQASYYARREKKNFIYAGNTEFVNGQWDLTAGWGVEWNWNSLSLYGGPLVFFGSARLEHERYDPEFDETLRFKLVDIAPEDNLGWYGGVRYRLGRGWMLTGEAQYRGGLSIGTGVVKAF